jgi:hypothetical protein
MSGGRDGTAADRHGLDERGSRLTALVGRLVPQRLAKWAVTVSVETDRDRYAPGETVEITIEFHNRLPVPVTVETPTPRLWEWRVDGERAGRADRPYEPSGAGTLRFRGGESKRLTRQWNGRFEREAATGREFVLADLGPHEVTAGLATTLPRPSDATTIVIEE